MVIDLLLLEDNDVDAQWVTRVLSKFHRAEFRVHRAESLAAALDQLGRSDFGIILSDLKVPDGFGLEIFDALHRRAPHLPIVLLTGTIEQEQVALEALQKGAQDYLFKGKITEEALARSLSFALERHRLIRLRNHFVNITSHELRNPLAILRESISQLGDGTLGSLNAPQKGALDMALRTIDRLVRTTGELLQLATLESGKGGLKKERFDLTILVKELVEQFEPEAKKKSLKLSTRFPSQGGVWMDADRDQIARVFTNLIHNALKFTEKGSIEVALRESPDGVECAVADTGEGIAREDQEKVFSQFGRLEMGFDPRHSGTGLGLSICREIVQLHGGRIWVESQPGNGSRFIFSVPKKEAA